MVRCSFESIGSSPRMRGAHVQAFDVALVRGIIPADAGSTPPIYMAVCSASGSSPRMRGALRDSRWLSLA